MEQINLQGKIIISQPKNRGKFFSNSVVFIAKHDRSGAWGIMINRPIERVDYVLDNIMETSGIERNQYFNDPIYIGGPVETYKINVVHSLDWFSFGTLKVTHNIGITSDISILTALSRNNGPSYYRVCCGICAWAPDQLEGEQSGRPPWMPEHRWLVADITGDYIFNTDYNDQWKAGIDLAVKQAVDSYFPVKI